MSTTLSEFKRTGGALARATSLAVIVMVSIASATHAQTALAPEEVAALQGAYRQSRAVAGATEFLAEAITQEVVVAPMNVAALPDSPGLRESVDLYRALTPTGNSYRPRGGEDSTGKLPSTPQRMLSSAALGGRVTECEFAFGVRAPVDNHAVQPYVVVSFYDVGGPAGTELAPVRALAFRFDAIHFSAAGSYVVRSGLIDLAAAGLDFDLKGTFAVEIVPLAWSGTEAVSDTNLFSAWVDHNDPLAAREDAGDAALVLRGRDPALYGKLKLSVGDEFGACVQPNEPVAVELLQEDLEQPIEGYEAWIQYDATNLQFDYGVYTHEPYDDWIVYPITSEAGPDDYRYLHVHAEIVDGVQDCTQDDTLLVTLYFTALTDGLTEVEYRSNEAPDVVTRFFNCGNHATLLPQKVLEASIFIDSTPPTITALDDLPLQCTDEIPPKAETPEEYEQQGGYIYDESQWYCGLSLECDETITPGSGCEGDPYIVERSYRAIDGADNIGYPDPLTQTITVVDDTPPTLTCPDPVTVQCPEDVPPCVTDPVAFNQLTGASLDDNCTALGDLVLTCEDSGLTDPCGGTITRTYRATDECGNWSECTQTITVDDTIAPTITCPDDVTVQCSDDVPACVTDPRQFVLLPGASLSDNCTVLANLVLTCENSALTDPCGGTITRTYRATDGCGNWNECTQTITVDDTQTPTITCPDDVSVQCPGNVSAPATDCSTWLAQGGTATDNCSDCAELTFVHVGDQSDGSTCPSIITRRYRVVDQCNNETPCAQTITVNDTIAPTITCPDDVSVQCPDDVPECVTDPLQFALLPGTALGDNCTALVDLVLTYEDSALTDPCGGTITRTYRATDECGNWNECTQTITVDDTELPTITCPDDVTVQCPQSIPTCVTDPVEFVQLPGASLDDNCTELADLALTCEDSDLTDPCGGTLTRTYRVTDACGNWRDCTQIFTVNDEVPPTIICPDDITVQCPEDVPPCVTDPLQFVLLPGASLSDNCTVPADLVLTCEDTSLTDPCGGTITRTYRTTDACGHSDECTQTITVNDTEPPQLTCDDVTVDNDTGVCEASVTLACGVSDNCADDPLVTYWIDDELITNPHDFPVGTTTVRAEARDACYNQATPMEFYVTVEDNEDPVISGCPPPEAEWAEWPEGSGDYYWIVRGAAVNPSGGPVTWTDPTYSDNCGVTASGCQPPSGSFFNLGELTQVCCTAEDAAGSTVECCFHVVVVDDPPCICCPGDISAVCDGDYCEPSDCECPLVGALPPYPNDLHQCSAEVCLEACACDDLPGVVATYWIESNPAHNPGVFDQPIGACHEFPVGTTEVQAIAVDSSGQTSEESCIFPVTVTDEEAPLVNDCPGDIMVYPDEPDGCTAAVDWTPPQQVWDNCGWVGVIPPDYVPGDTFWAGATTIEYTYYDMANNETVCSFDIIVVDNILPVIHDCPPAEADEEVEWPEGSGEMYWAIRVVPDVGSLVPVNWTSPTATDNCGMVNLTWTHDPGDLFEAGTTTPVTYTARDRAGNEVECTFLVIVEDQNTLSVDVELWPPASIHSLLTRCITFELWDCTTNEPVEIEHDITFVGGMGRALLVVPAGNYTCATARDKLHTLRRTDEGFHSEGSHYVADFTGNPFNGGDALIGGNLFDPPEDEIYYIDILDFGVLNWKWAVNYGTGNTPCTWCDEEYTDPLPCRHADVDGDGLVFVSDFTFIQTRFLEPNEANCCGQPGRPGNAPVAEISVAELRARGWGELAAGDLNHDGWLNVADIEAFMSGARPLRPQVTEPHQTRP